MLEEEQFVRMLENIFMNKFTQFRDAIEQIREECKSKPGQLHENTDFLWKNRVSQFFEKIVEEEDAEALKQIKSYAKKAPILVLKMLYMLRSLRKKHVEAFRSDDGKVK